MTGTKQVRPPSHPSAQGLCKLGNPREILDDWFFSFKLHLVFNDQSELQNNGPLHLDALPRLPAA